MIYLDGIILGIFIKRKIKLFTTELNSIFKTLKLTAFNMNSNIIIISTIGIVLIYFLLKWKPSYNSPRSNNQIRRDFAAKFYDFIIRRKKEINNNELDHSLYLLEMEVAFLIVEAHKKKLFPHEILKILASYSNVLEFANIENEIARKEIVVLEKYFYNQLN